MLAQLVSWQNVSTVFRPILSQTRVFTATHHQVMCCVASSCVKWLHHVSCGLWGCVNLCKHAQSISQKQVWHVPPVLTHPFSLPVDCCESVVNPPFTSLSINSHVGLLYVVVLSLPPLDNSGHPFLLYSSLILYISTRFFSYSEL